MNSTYSTFLFSVSLLILFSCTPKEKPETTNDNIDSSDSLSESDLNTSSSYKLSPSKESINIILKSIPSPLDFSQELISSKPKLDKTFIVNPNKKASDFINASSMAVALGMYSVDLSYINIYKENTVSTAYYSSIMDLAKNLYVEQFFNTATVTELKNNEKNTEKLIEIIHDSYNKINDHLKSHDKQDLSYLILFGSWLESATITIKHYDAGLTNLKEKIAYQKVTVHKMLNVFNTVKSNPNLEEIKKDLFSLSQAFDAVKVSYNNVSLNDSGDVVVQDNATSDITDVPNIEIQDADLENIKKIILALNTKYQNK